jgi:hypothetical protein
VSRDVVVRFASGRDLLNAYWGYLSDGGLVIDDETGLAQGQQVALRIHIESTKAHYRLTGRVVRHAAGEKQAVIAFDPGEPHDMLLTAALAETDNVPAREHRRFPVDIDVRVAPNGATAPTPPPPGTPTIEARVVNIGFGGCCVRLPPAARGEFSVGTSVSLVAPTFTVRGTVVWTWHADRGVQFYGDDAGCEQVKLLVARL